MLHETPFHTPFDFFRIYCRVKTRWYHLGLLYSNQVLRQKCSTTQYLTFSILYVYKAFLQFIFAHPETLSNMLVHSDSIYGDGDKSNIATANSRERCANLSRCDTRATAAANVRLLIDRVRAMPRLWGISR